MNRREAVDLLQMVVQLLPCTICTLLALSPIAWYVRRATRRRHRIARQR